MRRAVSIALLLISISLFAGAEEVNYYNRSWQEIMEKARAEHKYILVDCYTDWCGWCKVMDKRPCRILVWQG